MNITISKQLPPVSITPASPSVMHAMEMSQKEMPDRPDKNASSFLAQWLLPVTMLLLLGSVIAAYRLHPEFEALRQEKMHTAWGSILLIAGGILIVLQLCFLLYILTLYVRYKPVASVSDELLPACTVIVPAYNEGSLVWHTLISLANSHYPREKLQIIAIDDGSVDDTWRWMQLAKEQLGDRLSICQQPKNMGKRQALYRGFKLGTGDIFVTVDSDSIVKKDTLRNMTSPFVVNKNCGAVAGNVSVLNKKAVIPKMLNISFAFTFEFIRSAQSVLGTVLCTPGALASYRRDAVLACLPQWLNQRFMGKPSDIGEDRALTNMILRQGLHVVFQSNAIVYTNTPENFNGLYKMFIRWERSNVRENIAMGKFVFGKFREGAKAGSRIILLDQWRKLLLSYPMLFLMLGFALTHPLLFVCSALSSVLVFASIQVFFYAKKHNLQESFWAYPYSIFYTFALFWITPYSIATAGKSGWLTRNSAG